MRAAWIDALGPPEVIRFGELPVPAIGPTDLLIRVHATAVNPVDTFIRSGRYRTPLSFPFIIGRDLVGQVCERGRSVVRTRIGDWVSDDPAVAPDSTAARVALWRALHVEIDPAPHRGARTWIDARHDIPAPA